MSNQKPANFVRLSRDYLSPHKAGLLFGGLFVTISNMCSAYYPRLIGQTVDVIAHGDAMLGTVLTNIGYILLLTLGSGFFMFATRKTIIVASRKIEYQLRRDFLAALEQHSQRYFDRMPTGVLMAHATNDISAVREFLGPAIMYSANTVTTFAFVITLMIALDPLTTGVALLPLPFIALTTYKIGKQIYGASRRVQEEFSNLTRHAQEAFSGIRIIRAFVREPYEEGLFAKQSKAYVTSNVKLARLNALFMPSMMMLVGSAQLLVLLFGGYRVVSGELSIGSLTQFFIYLGQLIWPIAAIGWVTGIIQRSAASLDRLYSVLDAEPEIKFPHHSLRLPRRFDISCKDVSFSYDAHKPVLTKITCAIEEGKHVGIVGPIGSGKSTLVRLLARLYDPDSGAIAIDNVPIAMLNANDLRQFVRCVPQESFLFSMSIAENICVGNPQATENEIWHALDQAGIADEVSRFPDGLNTIVGERGVLLSGGQRQRLAIARALIGRPQVLLFDDALSAVDTQTERHILAHLRKLNCTTIIVTHRISTIEHCDEIFVLEQGRITAHGSHQRLLSTSSFYQKLYERQLLEQQLQLH
ncbi:MAG: ABC transporter ATP-binding protein/permease [Chlorobi bacterium]|nr:ABC transporter ATP-binding protein/permease [Chlorobiota bacterium]